MGRLTLEKLETLRKSRALLRSHCSLMTPVFAGEVIDRIDEYVDNLKGTDLVAGDATQAAALKEARGLYTRNRKADTIDELRQKAEDDSEASGIDIALRNQFKSLAKDKRRMRLFKQGRAGRHSEGCARRSDRGVYSPARQACADQHARMRAPTAKPNSGSTVSTRGARRRTTRRASVPRWSGPKRSRSCPGTGVSDELYERVREQFSEDELVHLSLAIVSING